MVLSILTDSATNNVRAMRLEAAVYTTHDFAICVHTDRANSQLVDLPELHDAVYLHSLWVLLTARREKLAPEQRHDRPYNLMDGIDVLDCHGTSSCLRYVAEKVDCSSRCNEFSDIVIT